MGLPKFLQPYLASYDLSMMDPERDSNLIITPILNYGSTKAVRWLFRNYSLNKVKEAVKNPERGMWFRNSFSYWQKILDVKTSKFVSEIAIINFNPRPKLYEKFFKLNVSQKNPK